MRCIRKQVNAYAKNHFQYIIGSLHECVIKIYIDFTSLKRLGSVAFNKMSNMLLYYILDVILLELAINRFRNEETTNESEYFVGLNKLK